MDCKDIRASLPAWALGDVPGPEAAEIGRHVAACEACRREGEALRRAVDIVKGTPSLPSSPDRYRALLRAAEAEGLLPRRARALRWAVPAALLASAAAAALFFLAPGWFAGPAPGPGDAADTPEDPGERPTISNPVAYFVDGRGVSLIREGKAQPRAMAKKDHLYRGDRVLVEAGEGNQARLRFLDSLDLDVLPGPGGAELRIDGPSEEAYRIHVDHGRLFGRFPQPIEILTPRNRTSAFIPLAVTSPVGQAEVWKGRDFKAFQEKIALPENYFEYNRALDAVSMHFRAADLLDVVGRLRTRLDGLEADPDLVRGKKITILCNTIPTGEIHEALDAAIAPLGLQVSSEGGKRVVAARPGGPLAPQPGWEDPAYGEFLVELESPDGEAKISSRNPRQPGALVLRGGQKGVVRPGAAGANPLDHPPIEVKTLEKVELLGTMVAVSGLSMAVVELSENGTAASRAVRPGDEIAGYRCERVAWDHLLLTKAGVEYRLVKR